MPDDAKGFRELILDWIDEAVADGLDPNAAVQGAVTRTIKSGYSDQALEAIGVPIFLDFWRGQRGQERRNAVQHIGGRRVNVDALNEEESLFDKLIAVGGGKWVPWGDMTRKDCLAVTTNYRQLERGVGAWRKAWDELSKTLKGEQTVRQRLSEEELKALFRNHVGAATPPAALPV